MSMLVRLLTLTAFFLLPVFAAEAEPCRSLVTEAQFARLSAKRSLEPVANRIRLGRQRLTWNGSDVNPTMLHQYLAITTTMTPTPVLMVSVEQGTEARLVQSLRDLIGAVLHCEPGTFEVAHP